MMKSTSHITKEQIKAKVDEYRLTLLERYNVRPEQLGLDLEATARFILDEVTMPQEMPEGVQEMLEGAQEMPDGAQEMPDGGQDTGRTFL